MLQFRAESQSIMDCEVSRGKYPLEFGSPLKNDVPSGLVGRCITTQCRCAMMLLRSRGIHRPMVIVRLNALYEVILLHVPTYEI